MDNIDPSIMNYWIKSSDEDYITMQAMKESHRNTWTLFVGHLVIEKLLKALYAKNNKSAPYADRTHNLLLFTKKCNLELTDKQLEMLLTITEFNLNARYDDYKESFRNKCTDEYTSEQVKNIKGSQNMDKTTIDKEIIDNVIKFVEEIKKYYNVKYVILFGSYAKGTENANSDIDVAIVSDDFTDIIDDGAKLFGLTWNIDTRIEPHPITLENYKNETTPFVVEVKNTGIKVA